MIELDATSGDIDSHRADHADLLLQLVPAFDALPVIEARARRCVPLRDAHGRLVVAAAPSDRMLVIRWLDGRTDEPYTLIEQPPELIARALEHHATSAKAMDTFGVSGDGAATAGIAGEVLSLDRIQVETSTTIRLTNSIVYDAYRIGASDIHFETTAHSLRVKYRLDGVLAVVSEIPGIQHAEEAISRLNRLLI